MEIERKYLVNQYPYDLNKFKSIKIIQGYISTDPVIRIRKANKDYYLTCKGKGLLAREEFELDIDSKTFTRLCKKVDYNLIEKTRYNIPYDDALLIELDIFEGIFEGLIIAEVEFTSIESSKDFIAPSWFLEELTQDGRYHNSQLCQLNKKDISNLLM